MTLVGDAAKSIKGSAATRRGRVAVALICDENYFLPTFSTALSADRHIRRDDVDICIFVVGCDERWVHRLDDAVAGTKIVVRAASLPDLAQVSRFHRDRYLPPITLARLWVSDLLDADIDRFLYIDGDTMVDGELDSLLEIRPPDEGLMAAPDNLRLFLGEVGLKKNPDLVYLDGLGCEAAGYFNCGVIYTSRDAWRAIVPAAIDFLTRHPERCRSSDQSALNHAARGRVVMLPLKYNYQSEHMMVFDPRDTRYAPVIWHFTAAPKPWEAAEWPWDEYFNRFYRDAERRLSGCDVVRPVPPAAQTQAGLAHRKRTRNRLTWIYPWRKRTRGQRVLRLMQGGQP